MDSRWARVVRGLAAATFATFVAAFTHTLAGGSAPSFFAIAVTLVISAMVCTILTARTMSLWRLAASVSLSQLLFHGLFSSLVTPVAAGHDMGSMGTMDAASPHVHVGTTMSAAHAAAALVTVLAFRFGEQAFWSVVNTARLFVTRLMSLAVALFPASPVKPSTVERRFVPTDLAVLFSSMRHRGPPLPLSA